MSIIKHTNIHVMSIISMQICCASASVSSHRHLSFDSPSINVIIIIKMHLNSEDLDIIWPTSFLYRKVMSCTNLYYSHFSASLHPARKPGLTFLFTLPLFSHFVMMQHIMQPQKYFRKSFKKIMENVYNFMFTY